jgi:hypothetical protein
MTLACVWAPRDLDETAYLEQVKMIAWCIEESERLEVETVERRANAEGDAESFHVTFAIAGFPSPTHSEVKTRERKKRAQAKHKRKRKPPKAKGKGKGGGGKA